MFLGKQSWINRADTWSEGQWKQSPSEGDQFLRLAMQLSFSFAQSRACFPSPILAFSCLALFRGTESCCGLSLASCLSDCRSLANDKQWLRAGSGRHGKRRSKELPFPIAWGDFLSIKGSFSFPWAHLWWCHFPGINLSLSFTVRVGSGCLPDQFLSYLPISCLSLNFLIKWHTTENPNNQNQFLGQISTDQQLFEYVNPHISSLARMSLKRISVAYNQRIWTKAVMAGK